MDSINYNGKEFISKLMATALPLALQNLMLASVAAADALMLGHQDQNLMSAVSLATQIQFVQNLFIIAITTVESIFGAQYWGKKDRESLDRIFCISLKLNAVVSIAFFSGCFFFPRFLMMIFTNESELIPIGVGYLQISAWSYLLTGISQTYIAMMKVTGHPGRSAAISSTAVIINIALNAVFIFGLLGAPKMDAKGAALATLIARIVELVWSVGNSYRKNYIHPSLKFMFSRSKQIFADFMKTLGPVIGASLFWGIGLTSYSAFMGHLGTDATAANSVAAVIRDLMCCFCNGLAGAAGIVIGNELGAGNLEKGKIYGQKILKVVLVASGVISIMMFAFVPLVDVLIKLEPLAKKYLIQMMLINSVYMYGRSLNTIVINGIFACGGDTLFDVYSLAVCMWCLAVPLAALGTFAFHWPVFVVYSCTCIDEVGKIPWVLHHFRKYKWVKNLTRD